MIPEGSPTIYANPCKSINDILECRDLGVQYTTFDSVSELKKLARWAFKMKLILRIKADDPNARCPMGNKFGATEPEWDILAREAKRLGLEIVGVSFHVGSFAQSPDAHACAIQKAYMAFQTLNSVGHTPWLLDIGGGFSSESLESIHPACAAINEAIIRYGFQNVIAEPGRFLVEHAIELHTRIIGTKDNSLTIDESIYGAFNCIVMDHANPFPKFQNLKNPSLKTIFGCTCDGADTIGSFEAPDDLKIHDVIIWPRMGAYTLAATTNFNGLGFDSKERIYLR
jgi:ornithine decarboxylase